MLWYLCNSFSPERLKVKSLSKVVAVICPPNSSWLGPKAAFTVQKLQFQAPVNKIRGYVITANVDCKRHALWQFLMVKSTLEQGFGCRNTHRRKKKLKAYTKPIIKSLFATQNQRDHKIKARMERKSSLRRFSVARACLHKLTSSRVIL